MPKAKWSNTDLTPDDINNAEQKDGFYAGPLPPKGVYRFKLRTMKQGVSGSGNDKIVVLSILDGSWKPDHKKFNGCPLFDHMPMGKESAWRSKALCAALGVSANDLLNKTIIDDDGYITKIGNKAIKEGMPLYISVRTEKQEDYDPALKLNGSGYMEAQDAIGDDEGDGDAAPDETPAAEKKSKKGGKKATSSTEEDPF
jgi:hypothetical protein